jgi:hypothetical protein
VRLHLYSLFIKKKYLCGDYFQGASGLGAAAGGVGSKLSGGNFWKGALVGGIVAGLNHVAHEIAFEIEQDIQQQKTIKFFNRLRTHYESKTGETFHLTQEEFAFLYTNGKVDFTNAKLIDSKNNIYQATIDFYDSTWDLKNTFGRATVTYRVVDDKILYRTFYDRYDFDPKPCGTRSNWSEIKTRAYHTISSGVAFDIIFNQNYLVQ